MGSDRPGDCRPAASPALPSDTERALAWKPAVRELQLRQRYAGVSLRTSKPRTRSGADRVESAVRSRGLALWLIEHAAGRAPPPLSQRLEEEWLADLAARDGRLSRLRFGLGCCWAATVIMHEHCSTSAAAAAGSAAGQETMIYAQHDAPLLPPRAIALLLIACVHTALISALVTGLRSPTPEMIPTTRGELLPEPRQPIQPRH